ncbi:hypothetical protein VKI21_12465 [Cyanobacterium aponinum UTEX 3222]|uniref:hypothetical protein n=1 Tax=Cyanobacterium aponinum TaxID=379064 RepID=UPI0013FDD4AB|nr:hypothetical protein [Cyanobacterium aponinum]WRL38834.1 hypothetical protein VKI22_01680 [Cyanobacterium aponinum UTEX 3221]WRL40872.1 hypothetical protein VKI21_12465 [Cyanobacterium aponinum UTEX 3222]
MNNFNLQEIINIIVPPMILFIGIFGLFSAKISEEIAYQLITSGGLATGITINKK